MITTVPIEELLWEEEGTTLDFKQKQYKFSLASDEEKGELLKDVVAFANAWRREDAYIIIGAKDVKGGRAQVLGITEELDDAQIQQFINSKTQKPIVFSYQVISVDTAKVAVISIPVQQRPIYLKKNYGKLKKGIVYLRRGSSTSEATPDEIFKMGQSENQFAKEVPSLSLEFANRKNRVSLGAILSINPTLLNIPPDDKVPDFEDTRSSGPLSLPSLTTTMARKDYFRELIKYYFIREAATKLDFLIKNTSSHTLTDIRVELNMNNKGGVISLLNASDIPEIPDSHYDYLSPSSNLNSLNIPPLGQRPIEIHTLPNEICVEIPFEKAQPKQTVFSFESIFILVREDCDVQIDVTIFSDDLPEPVRQSLIVACKVNRADGSFEAIRKMHTKDLIAKLNRV